MATRILGFARLPLTAGTPTNLLGGILRTLVTWQGRAAQRCHLADVEERLLKDMGLSRENAMRESTKPFWRA